MSFLNNLVNEFTHKSGNNQNQGYPPQQQQYGGGSGYPPQPYNNERPQVPPPWIAEWDAQDNRWLFIDRETGHRTFDHPQQQYGGGYGGGPAQQNQGYGYGQSQGGYPQEVPSEKKSHTGRNAALAGVAGLAGGALLMHEGEKVEERWDEDKYRLENDVGRADDYVDNKVADGIQNVEDFPDDAARWTGRKVQEVEDIPEDIDRKWDNAVQDVEHVPDDVARWTGDKVGDVERFGDDVDRYGDRLDDAYDDGRDDARYDDDDRGRW